MINYFNFKQFNSRTKLITNESGDYAFISNDEFDSLLKGDQISENTEKQLEEKSFIYNGSRERFIEKISNDIRCSKSYLFHSTSLHIFVVTNICNYNCVYCQAQHDNQSSQGKMSKEVARKAVDLALQSPSQYLTFEFQGGEPFINFDVIKYIVEYTETQKKQKKVRYTVVSNLSLLSEEIVEFLTRYSISISTSLDGDSELQNKNRPSFSGLDTYAVINEKIPVLRKAGINLGAIQTTTRYSLDKYRKIVDEYIKKGFDTLFIRPLTRLGKASESWPIIGYNPEEFVNFYSKAFDYIIEKNKSGVFISEGHAVIFLHKILYASPEDYMDLRSPCGGVIGQLAYYYDGNVYTCDEGRMLSEMGNDAFLIGNVYNSDYESIINSDTCKAVLGSSCLECIPECCDCVYHPYCGVCPVVNFAIEGDVFPRTPNSDRCRVYKGILDKLFSYLYMNDKEEMDILRSWLN